MNIQEGVIVIDIGSWMVKAGLGGTEDPQVVFQSIFGVEKFDANKTGIVDPPVEDRILMRLEPMVKFGLPIGQIEFTNILEEVQK